MQVSYFKMSTQDIISEYGLLTALMVKRNKIRARLEHVPHTNWRTRHNMDMALVEVECDIMTVLDGSPVCMLDTVKVTTADVGDCDACPLAATCRTANAS